MREWGKPERSRSGSLNSFPARHFFYEKSRACCCRPGFPPPFNKTGPAAAGPDSPPPLISLGLLPQARVPPAGSPLVTVSIRTGGDKLLLFTGQPPEDEAALIPVARLDTYLLNDSLPDQEFFKYCCLYIH